MSEDCDHARSQAGHDGMGVRIVDTDFLLTILAPATDDPIIAIALVMGVSGVLMLVCGGLGIAARIRRAREEKEAGKNTRK